jgi:hypothetical protein
MWVPVVWQHNFKNMQLHRAISYRRTENISTTCSEIFGFIKETDEAMLLDKEIYI